eukprot:5765277-Prymnesium_polylepis.1
MNASSIDGLPLASLRHQCVHVLLRHRVVPPPRRVLSCHTRTHIAPNALTRRRAARVVWRSAAGQPKVRQPFDDLLDYSNFSLTLDAADIPQLPALLSAISDEQHFNLRLGLRAVAPAFTFAGDGAIAYNYTVWSLRKRAGLAEVRDVPAH